MKKKVTIGLGKNYQYIYFRKINQISFIINFEKPATYNKFNRLSSNQSGVF